MFLLFVFFLLHTTETSGEVCPEEKKVGDICYTRVAMTDTQQYGCKENCTYKKTNSSDTTQYCFQRGDLQVTKCGSLFVACDNRAEVFLDGVQFTDPAMDQWDKTSEISLPSNTKTIAISCRNSEGHYGIKASTDSGIVTDGTWRCNNIKEDNWMMTDFDDSTWEFAKTDNLYVYTALSRPQISTSAKWIWSQIGTDQAYCRKSISQGVTKGVTCGDGQTVRLCNECPDNEAGCTSDDCEFLDGKCEKRICQSGWKEFNGRCYYFSSDRKARSWNQARAECTGLNLGADLASIGSKEDEDYIARNAGDPIWILLGGTDADTEGQWRWTDGRPWVYSGWRNGDPKGGTVENCLTMKNPDWDKFWNDGPCDFIYEPSPLICSYKPDKGCLDCLRDDCPQCVPPCTGVGCQDCVMANCLRECGSDPCNPQ